MKKYSNYKSNYDKFPVVSVTPDSENMCWSGWSRYNSPALDRTGYSKKEC